MQKAIGLRLISVPVLNMKDLLGPAVQVALKVAPCAMRRFSMRHVLCAMRRFPMRHARCAVRYVTISYALRDNFLCVMRDVLYAMAVCDDFNGGH